MHPNATIAISNELDRLAYLDYLRWRRSRRLTLRSLHDHGVVVADAVGATGSETMRMWEEITTREKGA